MIKTILISQVALPYSSIGSWTTLYQNYFNLHSRIDCIVCPRPKNEYEGIEYSFVKETWFDKMQRKLFKKKKREYLSALKKLIIKDGKYVFQVVDNYGMVKPLYDFLVENNIREKCYIQFFYHGFDPYQQDKSSENFYKLVDEIIVLTQSSYDAFKNKIVDLPQYLSILNNGIDTTKFLAISKDEKAVLKKSLGFEDKKVFLWCSQDRPKKGLHVILDAWAKIYSVEKSIILVVIGCEARQNTKDVLFLGKIPNDELPKYYQAADCFLFSTLCQEGFGMSLIEAKHCGCYCIASNLGAVPEVLHYGKYGKLVENPTVIENWICAIEDYLNNDFEDSPLPQNLFSTQEWNKGLNDIINEAIIKLNNN